MADRLKIERAPARLYTQRAVARMLAMAEECPDCTAKPWIVCRTPGGEKREPHHRRLLMGHARLRDFLEGRL